jgi:hypothetical protein
VFRPFVQISLAAADRSTAVLDGLVDTGADAILASDLLADQLELDLEDNWAASAFSTSGQLVADRVATFFVQSLNRSTGQSGRAAPPPACDGVSPAANGRSAACTAARHRHLGCAFALDDFGVGYAPFTYLRQLPVTYLKIDIQFVRNVLTDTEDRRIVQGFWVGRPEPLPQASDR